MEFSRGGDGKLTPLANKNIDTGMGLERMAQILQKVPNNYETDLIFPIIQKAAEARRMIPSFFFRISLFASVSPSVTAAGVRR